jgi:DNA-3-methyladenine glycosylase
MPLDRSFYVRPTLEVARDLLGTLLVHDTPAGRASGIIVEVEAYIGESDPACHAAAGRTRRTAPLYGPPGIAYVYLNYGMHYLVNAVTEAVDRPAAVLIRALHPLEGIALMRRRRVRGTARPASSLSEAAICRGPGNLTRALGISLRHNGLDLCGRRLTIEEGPGRPGPVARSRRIGISVGTDVPWRFYVEGHPAVSGRAAVIPPRPGGASASVPPLPLSRPEHALRGSS